MSSVEASLTAAPAGVPAGVGGVGHLVVAALRLCVFLTRHCYLLGRRLFPRP